MSSADSSFGGESGGKPPHSKAAVTDRRYNPAPTIPDIMRAGGFDCVIGNPPYGAALITGKEEIPPAQFQDSNEQFGHARAIYGKGHYGVPA